jgi:hypothetical protein
LVIAAAGAHRAADPDKVADANQQGRAGAGSDQSSAGHGP